MRDIGERKAAETIVAACDLPGPTYRHAALQLHGEEVARAYLALLDERDREAAEQAQAVDEEWLRSVGFMEGWKELYLLEDGTQLSYRNSHIQTAWVLNNCAYPLNKWPTRSSLLRLLAALGVGTKGAT